MLTWELVGAVVGAGLASGREIASFFSRYGAWSWLGITLAVITLAFLSDADLPKQWRNRWPEQLWQVLLALLLAATGGAMLSGAGEVAALALPITGAYWMSVAGTLALAWFLAHRTAAGLAWVSRILLSMLAVLILLGMTLPPMQAVPIVSPKVPTAILQGMTYGGFNAALQRPLLTTNRGITDRARTRSASIAAVMIGGLLALANVVLLRHPALMSEPMPFIRMVKEFGVFGYYLGAGCLYLAILSTLTACLRGLGSGVIPVVGIAMVSMLGFTGVVERVYPLLGASCFLMLIMAKFMNSFEKPFNSSRDML